jgi:chromosome segregation ATPase
MVEATEIEKKSLEAHVELCAERYNAVDEKLNTLTHTISHLCDEITIVKDTLAKMAEKSSDRLINWGVGIIGFLAAGLVATLTHILIK